MAHQYREAITLHTLVTHFGELLANIRPPQERLDAATTLPPLVRTYLKNHEEFETLYPHSRLVGSYAQHLSAGDVKDVDFLVRVGGSPEDNDPPAKDLIKQLKSALDALPDALKHIGYANIELDRARRSVHVYFPKDDFHLDVVPCIAPDEMDKPIWVPDRGYNKWIETHPLGVVNAVESLTKEHGENFRNMVKLLKHFRNVHMRTRKPKSYWLVTMGIQAVEEGYLELTQPIAVVFADLLEHLHARFLPTFNRVDGATPHIQDPMLGHDISWNWERSHFETFMRRLDDGRKWADKAVTTDDKDVAINRWQRIFGEDWFPSNVDRRAQSLANVRQPGAAVVTGTGLILPTGTDGKTTPVPSTRYYGRRDG